MFVLAMEMNPECGGRVWWEFLFHEVCGESTKVIVSHKRPIAVVVSDWFSFGVGKVGNEMKFGTNCCVGVVNTSESVSMIQYLKMKKMPSRDGVL